MKIRAIVAALILPAGLALVGLVANASASLRTTEQATIISFTQAYAIAGAGAEASISISYE